MSLLRLLTAGKSLVGIHENESRYRLRSQGMLPKFAAKKNPFRASAEPALRAASSAAVAEQLSPPSNPSPPGQDEEPIRPAEIPATSPAPAAQSPSTEQPQAAVGGSGTQWGQKAASSLRRFFQRAPRPAKPIFGRSPKPLVQAELSLDSIKVVRNDLSDSDLEVVQAKPAANAVARRSGPPAPALGPVEPVEPVEAESSNPGRPELAGSAWGRVSNRLFGAGKS